MGTGLALGLGDQMESLRWLLGYSQGGQKQRAEENCKKGAPGSSEGPPPAAAAAQDTWQELLHSSFKLVIQGAARL